MKTATPRDAPSSIGNGLSAMSNHPWTIGNGHWPVNNGLRAMVCRRWEGENKMLQQWCKQADERFPKAHEEGTAYGLVELVESDARALVVGKHLFEAQSHVAVVEEDVRLEIVLERAEVDVR